MVGGQLFILFCHNMALFLRPGDHLDCRFLYFNHGNRLVVLFCGQQSRLVCEIFKVRAGKSGCRSRNRLEIHVRANRLVFRVYAQNCLASLDIGIANGNLAVKASRTQQRRIEDIAAVCRSNDNDAAVGAKAIHFDKQLIERLFALIVAAAESRAAMTPNGVDFIDKDNRRRIFLRLLEQVAHTRCADADKHLHKIRTGNGEKRHASLSRHSLGQKRLTCSGRSHQQHALGDARAQ